MNLRRILGLALLALSLSALAGNRYNFNAGWLMKVGDDRAASRTDYADSQWQQVTLPRAFNQEEAFARAIDELTDTVVWYRKHFTLAPRGQKYFIEFEGVRFAAQVFLNGHEVGWHENGVMAFGMDLTPYINKEGENVLAVRVDNDWKYRERQETLNPLSGKLTHSGYQWNDKNFYCNYGGINKNVWLHVMTSDIYQTLPLYSNLGTTGTYVYATDIDVEQRKATINVASQVKNDSKEEKVVFFKVLVNSGISSYLFLLVKVYVVCWEFGYIYLFRLSWFN